MLPFIVRTCSYFAFLPTELSYVMLCQLCISQCYYRNHNKQSDIYFSINYLFVENLLDQYALNIFQTSGFPSATPHLYAYSLLIKADENWAITHSSSSRKFINSSGSICSNDSIGKGDGLLLSEVA